MYYRGLDIKILVDVFLEIIFSENPQETGTFILE